MMREKLEALAKDIDHDLASGTVVARCIRALIAESREGAKAEAGEPVAWMRYLQGDVFQCDKDRDDAFPVYARPAPADGAVAQSGFLVPLGCTCSWISQTSHPYQDDPSCQFHHPHIISNGIRTIAERIARLRSNHEPGNGYFIQEVDMEQLRDALTAPTAPSEGVREAIRGRIRLYDSQVDADCIGTGFDVSDIITMTELETLVGYIRGDAALAREKPDHREIKRLDDIESDHQVEAAERSAEPPQSGENKGK